MSEAEIKELPKCKVAAVVVTYNRKELLRECLQALLQQTRPPDEIIVIDNASTDGTEQMVPKEFPQVTYVRLPENIGGAGGFYEGMKLAYEKGYDWIWMMDDDAVPSKTCLHKLLTQAKQGDVLVPILIGSEGRRYGVGYWRGRYVRASLEAAQDNLRIDLFSFVGPLIHRRVPRTVGFPRKDFFISGDDLEYALRIRKVGFTSVAIVSATIYHEYGGKVIKRKRLGRTSNRNLQPAWKCYYQTRNGLLMLQNLNFWERLQSYPWRIYNLFRHTLGDILYEPEWKKRIYYRWIGFFHGIIGISGRKVQPK